MLNTLITKLMQHKNLSYQECNNAMSEILQNTTPEQSAAFLTLLHSKPETTEEIQGLLSTLKNNMTKISLNDSCLDIVGTGGDGHNTINISTATSFVTASIGVKTAKHGNRSVSSACGSADLIEALNINLDNDTKSAQSDLDKNNFCFLYAPNFNPGFKNLKNFRKALGVRTTLNMMGPLLNPCDPDYYLMGVYHPNLLQTYANILSKSSIKRALIVHSCGLDEISLLGPSEVIEINGNQQKKYVIDPREYGLDYVNLDAIQGGDALYNKNLILQAFSNENQPIKNTIILNAAAALYASFKVTTLADGISLARSEIQSGNVMNFINKIKSTSC